jgi:hypothetical protein
MKIEIKTKYTCRIQILMMPDDNDDGENNNNLYCKTRFAPGTLSHNSDFQRGPGLNDTK